MRRNLSEKELLFYTIRLNHVNAGFISLKKIKEDGRSQFKDIQGVWIESFYRYLRRMEGSINGYSRRMDRSQFTNIQGECTESIYGYSRNTHEYI